MVVLTCVFCGCINIICIEQQKIEHCSLTTNRLVHICQIRLVMCCDISRTILCRVLASLKSILFCVSWNYNDSPGVQEYLKNKIFVEHAWSDILGLFNLFMD